MKNMKSVAIFCFVLISIIIGSSGFVHRSNPDNSSTSVSFKQTSDLEGLYKTDYNKGYLEVYGTLRYYTLEFR